MSAQNTPPSLSPSFDQIVKGDVCITKLKNKKNMYRITFSKIGKFLIYQVWDKDNTLNRNSRRYVFRLPAKEWVNYFIQLNKDLKEKGKELFTPTTIMETTSDDEYAFVIRKIHFDSHDRVVFTVSTKEIQLSNNCSKKLIQIPCGKFYNMRFDVDDFISDIINAFTFTDTINEIPSARITGVDSNGMLCWGIGQLSTTQNLSLRDKFYFGINVPYPENKFFRDSNGRAFCNTCRSYGQPD